ncbi:acetylxylan esterase [Paenibacillus silvisoli]|uniref:acetylxylan esterase n=1 Tax=Paenibacillus silvisoli TaxID=3110539 RepID=UPI002803B44A|nr:alpha/beta fold hydrolase [Paenibacillus silvisoli]
MACTAELTIDPAQLDAFWDGTLSKYDDIPLNLKREPAESPFPGVTVDKITYNGADDTPIHAWFIVPQQAASDNKQIPCVVVFPGYTDDRGYPERYASWLLLGYAVFAVDVRGQGGETGNYLPERAGSVKGWVSSNLLEPEGSYYFAITMDAVRAVDAAASQPEVDPARLATVGGSQGGGLALISAALNRKVTAVVADIPNLCHMDHGVLNSGSSLTEIAQHLKRYPEQLETILHTIAHFDMLNLASRMTAPVLMSVGWKDGICLPETIYAVYNRIPTEKVIFDYPFSGHEINEFQNRERFNFLQKQFR